MTNRDKPITGKFYHVYNRGVEKRIIYPEEKDYVRFIHNLYEFNDTNPSDKYYVNQYSEVGLPYIEKLRDKQESNKKPRDFLVNILVFCLMPNHYHLLLKQVKDEGITEFMRKIGTGYTNYFNLKNDRVGPLFQGKYKAVLIEEDEHFNYLPNYIHLNPLELIEPNWKEGKLNNINRAVNFLESYRWSSYLDYIGKKNFPSLTQREFLSDNYQDPDEYKREVKDWLMEIEIDSIRDLTIELDY